MFGSKTTRLLSAIDRYTYQNKSIVAFKPRIDNRYDLNEITTHSGLKYPAVCISSASEMKGIIGENKVDVVAMDEMFMVEGSAEYLLELWGNGEPFEEVQKILPYATHIEKCPAVCVICQQDAFYTEKHKPGGENIEVGGADLYSPRCREHHSYFNA
jgi:thymidine kinase